VRRGQHQDHQAPADGDGERPLEDEGVGVETSGANSKQTPAKMKQTLTSIDKMNEIVQRLRVRRSVGAT
jgi:hypothetical protein